MARDDHRMVLTMNEATCTALGESGAALYALAAAQAADSGSVPMVWMQTREYSLSTRIEWGSGVEAFTSPAPFPPVREVYAGFSIPIAAGQALTVHRRSGIGTVAAQDAFEGIAIVNATPTPFTCGLSRRVQGAVAPVCALPLHGGALQVVVPVPRVLFFFSTLDIPPGTVLRACAGPGVLVDETAGQEHALGFDIDGGWTWEGGGDTCAVPAGTALQPLLLRRPQCTMLVTAAEAGVPAAQVKAEAA